MSPRDSTTAGAPPERPHTKGEQTAERILDAAEALFAEHGFAGTSLRDVASAVGIRTPSLYNHFESKDALYAAVLERVIGPVMAMLSGVMGQPGSHHEGDRHKLIEQIMDLLGSHPNIARLVLHETLTGGHRLTPMMRAWIGPIFEKSAELVETGPGAERWGRDEIPHLVLALYHVVVGYFSIAPLYEELNGTDLMTKEARARQTRFLVDLVDSLFADPPR